jgi:AcrR family transcriptional regulator
MISPEVVAEFKRRRILAAMNELCVEKTYQRTTMADIAARAGFSRSTLYQHFQNRAQVLEAAVEDASSNLLERVTGACVRAGEDRGERLSAGLAETLSWVASEPGAAWLCLVEAFRGTPVTRARYLDVLSRFGQMIGKSSAQGVARPSTFGDSLAGGIASVLAGMVKQEEGDRVPDMQEQFMVILQFPPAET